MNGEFSPDVAEIIKAPLAIYFLGMAAENNIPVRPFNTAEGDAQVDKGMSNIDLEEMMQENNPSFYQFLKNEAEKPEEEEPVQGGFLAVATVNEENEPTIDEEERA